MLKSEIGKPNTFLYFAYGSNIWTFRIHMNNPTAEFVSIGRLDNYRLDFIKYSKFWGGPTATPVPTANAHIWGVIWRLHTDNKASLDKQEGVDKNIYYSKYSNILTPYIGVLKCLVYEHLVIPLPRGDNDEIPIERWPSWTYKEVIVLGAEEHKLPEYYINDLKKIKHNGEQGCFFMACLLRCYGTQKPCQCRVPGRIPRKPLKLDLRELRAKIKNK
ncbi:gamma-glutamylcyclotransferase-like [Colias croceus]|uniref:gamma-glutamylcyclotransferase-like n=1 Tax=Colias crocea TaxID=72248 RepID=UPI001E27ADDD|nr:gamma-glutamylcyclotransferase-like [Colias croceus]